MRRKRTITAFLVGLKVCAAARCSCNGKVNEWREEPLTAILPGATLLEVWEVVAGAEKTLIAISALVVSHGPAGNADCASDAASANADREMAVLRAARRAAGHAFALLLGEATFLTLLGVALGWLRCTCWAGVRPALAGAAVRPVHLASLAIGHRV